MSFSSAVLGLVVGTESSVAVQDLATVCTVSVLVCKFKSAILCIEIHHNNLSCGPTLRHHNQCPVGAAPVPTKSLQQTVQLIPV